MRRLTWCLCIFFIMFLLTMWIINLSYAADKVEVKNIKVSDGKVWKVSDEPLGIGTPVYTDRAYLYTEFPEKYTGLTYIMSANDSKTTADLKVTFDINKPCWIYIFWWDNVLPKAWFSDNWEQIPDEIKTVNGSWPDQTVRCDVWKSKEPMKNTVSLFEINHNNGIYPGIVLEPADLAVGSIGKMAVTWGQIKGR